MNISVLGDTLDALVEGTFFASVMARPLEENVIYFLTPDGPGFQKMLSQGWGSRRMEGTPRLPKQVI